MSIPSFPHTRLFSHVYTEIVRIIKESGRFLKQEPTSGNWEEVDDESARYKVSSSFRTRRSVASGRGGGLPTAS